MGETNASYRLSGIRQNSGQVGDDASDSSYSFSNNNSGSFIASLTVRELISLATRIAVDLDEQKLVLDYIEELALTRPLTRQEIYRAALLRGAKVV